MSKHITGSELKQYFDIIYGGDIQEDDADFVDEIDAHAAGCEYCFERMQAVRVLMRSASSGPDMTEAFMQAEFPEPLSRPSFDIRKAFAGIRFVKEKLEGRVHILADTLSGMMDARFLSGASALSAVRGVQDADGGDGALNDLLRSDMELPLADGRKIVLRCRVGDSQENIRLFVCSNFEAEFMLCSEGEILCPVREDYDKVAGEYVRVYELDGSIFELTVP